MALSDLTTEAVEQAIQQFDQMGREAFLAHYGFKPARAYFVRQHGTDYDSKAIAGAAHGFLLGEKPLRAADFSGGDATVASVLQRLGFEIVTTTEPKGSPKNPTWSRDELILALDLYMTNPVSPPGKGSKAVAELSSILNALGVRLARSSSPTFRNPNGVYMKMMNFRRFDPDVIASGAVGLTRGNKDEEVVWNEFADDLPRLRAVADAIRKAATLDTTEFPAGSVDIDDSEEAEEGRVLTRLHRTRERNRKLVQKRKQLALQTTGKLACEACDFEFGKAYGEHGDGFIEVHHTKPIHTLPEGSKTKLSDLALLCSNCHRMVHARRKWLAVNEVRALLSKSVV